MSSLDIKNISYILGRMGSDRGAGGRPGTAARCTLRPRPSTASSATLLMGSSECDLVVCFDPLPSNSCIVVME